MPTDHNPSPETSTIASSRAARQNEPPRQRRKLAYRAGFDAETSPLEPDSDTSVRMTETFEGSARVQTIRL